MNDSIDDPVVTQRNPYQAGLDRAKARLAKLQEDQARLDANAIPGVFITGRSGVPRSRYKKLDRQLDRTIDLAVAIIKARQSVGVWQAKADRWVAIVTGSHAQTLPAKVRRPRPERLRLLAEAKTALEIDGRYVLPSGITIAMQGAWWESLKTPVGVVLVITPDGSSTYHIAKSIQGVHMMEVRDRVLGNLL